MLLPLVFGGLMGSPLIVKCAAAVGLILPLGFAMGLPFPLGLARVCESAPAILPWVWGIIGCASVVAAVMASLLAIHFGFTAVLAIALGLYLAAALVFGGIRGQT